MSTGIIGPGGAYSYAKQQGYAGTKDDFGAGLKNSAEYADNAQKSAEAAEAAQKKAETAQSNAETAQKAAQSYAVGGTSSRDGEDTDNAKAYSEAAKSSADSAAGSVKEISNNKDTIDAVHADIDIIKAVNADKEAIDSVNENLTAVKSVNENLTAVKSVNENAAVISDVYDSLDAIKDAPNQASAAAKSAEAAETSNQLALNAASTVSATDLETIVTNYYALRRTGKKYQTQIPIFVSNPSSTCTKVGINADLSWKPATDTDPGEDDYENIPLFQWVHCIYKRNADGSPYPVAIEGTALYDSLLAERKCDVGAMQMSFWVSIDDSTTSEGYTTMTISDLPFEGGELWSECRKADKTELPWCIGSAYISTLGDDGYLHSLPDGHPERSQSYNNMITNYAQKGDGYQGAGMERHLFQWIFEVIKGATKSSSTLFTGCCAYNFQYTCAVAESDVKRVIVTEAQAGSFVIGANVMLGDKGTGTSTDRGTASMYSIAAFAKVLSIEDVTINDTAYKAVNLDLKENISVTTDTYISSIHWDSGSTDKVIGHRDGSLESNTDSKHPYRVQGREYMVGGYEVASDCVIVFNDSADGSKDFYIWPKGTKHVANSYDGATFIGTTPGAESGATTSDFWIGDIAIDFALGGFVPTAKGSSSGNGMGDIFWGGGIQTAKTTRECLMGGNLGGGSGPTGFAAVHCGYGLGVAGWYCLSAD